MIRNVIKSWISFDLNKSNKKTQRNKIKMLCTFTGMTSVMTNLKLHNFVIINQVATNLFNFFLQILNKNILKNRLRSFFMKKLSSLKLIIKGQWIVTLRLRTLDMALLDESKTSFTCWEESKFKFIICALQSFLCILCKRYILIIGFCL